MAMTLSQPTSIDVIENFVTAGRIYSLDEAPGHVLWSLGEEIRQFGNAYTPASLQIDQHPVYIGGWPSANFWLSMNSPLLTSTLLYSGQIVVKDPLIDWFSLDRYQNQHVMGSRQGFLTDDGVPRHERNAQFSTQRSAWLMQFRKRGADARQQADLTTHERRRCLGLLFAARLTYAHTIQH